MTIARLVELYGAAGMICEPIEQRLVVAMFVDAEVLALCDELECDDFFGIVSRAMFTAIRNVQARGEPVDVLAVADEVESHDLERDQNMRESVNVWTLGAMVLAWTPYALDARGWLMAMSDIRHLRALAVARRVALAREVA